jgi:hypothetical protein
MADELCDVYGKGDPTDRLQFGYSPASIDEAIAYHGLFPTGQWVDERRRRYAIAITKRKAMHCPTLEPIESVFKLKTHWDSAASYQKQAATHATTLADGAEDFLALLSHQNADAVEAADAKLVVAVAAKAELTEEQKEKESKRKAAKHEYKLKAKAAKRDKAEKEQVEQAATKKKAAEIGGLQKNRTVLAGSDDESDDDEDDE